MERNANYALVGLISALLVIALLVFVVWLAGSGFSKTYDVYDVIFDGPVRGLSKVARCISMASRWATSPRCSWIRPIRRR